MIAAVWLMLSGLMYALQLSTGSFPKPLTEEEENHYLDLAEQGDLSARNVLIERNLRLVAHIMNNGYSGRKPPVANKKGVCVRGLRVNGQIPLECGNLSHMDKPGV